MEESLNILTACLRDKKINHLNKLKLELISSSPTKYKLEDKILEPILDETTQKKVDEINRQIEYRTNQIKEYYGKL